MELTPTLVEIIIGQVAAMSIAPPAEAAGDYAAARLGMLGMLAALATQEAERGVAARVWENRALEALFASLAPEYDETLEGRLAAAAPATPDLALSALDARNAELRRTLIAVHEAVEERGDSACERAIVDLYRRMAHARRLELPSALRG